MESKIDWSKAPEGASHYVIGWGFFKLDLAGWFICDDGEKVWRKTPYQSPDNFSWWGNAVERPSPSWIGEGLPPVGVVCEYNAMPIGKPEKWHKVEVVYVSGWVIVLRCIEAPDGHEAGNGVEIAVDVDSSTLKDVRPIRTPEQIAADEREAAILDIYQTICISRAQAEAIYDAGYRKP